VHIAKFNSLEEKLWQLYIVLDVFICISAAAFGTADAERATFMTKRSIPIGANAAIITNLSNRKTFLAACNGCKEC